jgi:serine/threonine protein kinase
MAFDADTLVGQTLGEYHLDRIIGIGSAGAVYLGHALAQPDQMVAIKVLVPPERLTAREKEHFRTRFLHETTTLTRLQHPHILTVHAVAEDEASGFLYMVTPHLAGGTLADLLSEGPLSFQQIDDVVTQLADALDYAHSIQVIHGDVKPANVLLDEQHNMYLADFGIARLLDTSTASLTDIRHMFGAATYLAPEQIADEPITPATDVYGLGVLTYQIVTGHLPYASSSLLAILRQITVEDPPAPTDFRPDLPVPAARAILRALAKQPEMRFASAGAFATAFTFGLQGKSATPPPHTLIDPGMYEGIVSIADGTPLDLKQESAHGSRRIPLLIGLSLLVLILLSSLWITTYGKHQTQDVIAGESSSAGTTSGQMTITATSATHAPAQGNPSTVTPDSHTPTSTQAPGTTPTAGTRTTPTATAFPTPTPVPGALSVSPSTQIVDDCANGGGGADVFVANTGAGVLNWSVTALRSPEVAFPQNGSLAPNQSVDVSISNIEFSGSITVSAPGAAGSPASAHFTCSRVTPCPRNPGDASGNTPYICP